MNAQQNSESKGLLDPSFKYVPSHSTDIAETFRRFGWTPPSKNK